MPTRVYDICLDCGQLIRPGRLDVHSRCRPNPAPEEREARTAEAQDDRLPVYLPLSAGAPCACPTCSERPTEDTPQS